MLLKYLCSIVFALLLIVTNLAKSLNLTGIYDINAIESFIEDIDSHIYNRYKWNVSVLKEQEKNSILKCIMLDLETTLDELNQIEPYDQYQHWTENFPNFINVFEDYQIKNGISLWSVSLMSYKGVIEEKHDAIQALSILIRSISDNHFEDSTDFCDYINGVVHLITKDHLSFSIAVYYQHLIQNILYLIELFDWRYNCDRIIPLNGELLKYYRMVMVAHIKLWSIMYYTGLLQARCQNEQSSILTRSIRNRLVQEFKRNIDATMLLAQHKNRYMYRCDSDISLTNNGYYELERMIQTVIINEISLSTKKTCDSNCNLESIKSSLNHSECLEFIDCKFITQDLDICQSDEASSRRYEWFKDSAGVIYGDNSQPCRNRVKSVESYYYASELRDCDYCVCTCRENTVHKNNVITALSFREQVTDVHKNMVVVGVRFMKKDFMIHVQIKVGKLKPRINGTVSRSNDKNKIYIEENETIEKMEIPDFNVESERLFKKSSANFEFDYIEWKKLETFNFNNLTKKYFVTLNNHVKAALRLGADYGHPSIMNFDDLIAPKGFVVTGVRFRFMGDSVVSRLKSGPIELQIQVTPFDYLQGKLINHHQTHWIMPKQNLVRIELPLKSPDKPTKSQKNIYDSKGDQFIQFGASNLKKDAGQSTVPFFDANEVEGRPAYPLGGIGIIHRGHEGYGGFLAFKIYDLDFSYIMNGRN